MSEYVTLPYVGGLTGTFTTVADEMFDWCDENNIDANLMENTSAGSKWHIEDEKERMMFILKWGTK